LVQAHSARKSEKIETYAIDPQNYVDRKLKQTFFGKEEIQYIISLFHTGDPIAYKISIQYDTVHHFFHPDDTNIIDERIKEFLE
jgi:hypothetical protein